MAQYPSLRVTNDGKNLIGLSNAKKKGIQYTKVVTGDGILNTNVDTLKNVLSPKLTVGFNGGKNIGNGQWELEFTVNNHTLESGFYCREIGIYAKLDDEDDTNAVLFAYTNGGNYVDYIPDKNTPIDSLVFVADIVVENATNVTLKLTDNTFLTLRDLDRHNTDEHAHDNRFKALEQTTQSLTSKVNGTLDKKYDKTGGTLNGDIVLSGDSRKIKTDDSGFDLTIMGGSEESQGAYIQLNGSGYPDNSNGQFCINASGNGAKRELIGNIDGTLKWDDDEIIRQSMLATKDDTSALSQAPTLQLVKSLLKSNLEDIAVIEMREYK